MDLLPTKNGATPANFDWPTFGWEDDIRPALSAARVAGEPAALATLVRVEGSAPRGPGAQMLFAGAQVSGYFSGDCIEGDIARHAADVIGDGTPKLLHYGLGSPWIDIRLRCGGALHIMVERIDPRGSAVADLLACAHARTVCRWISDGTSQTVEVSGGPLIEFAEKPFHLARRHDPLRRIIVTGGDPGALALARLAAQARFETILVRPAGPDAPPPFTGVTYLRERPVDVIARLGADRWTAYIGATHEDEHDLAGCLAALRGGAGYVGMIGAKSRAPGRLAALEAAGATAAELARLRLSPGIPGLGKAPWQVATGIVSEIMQVLGPDRDEV